MEIDVSPEMGMYRLLESYPYDLVSALSEYIDNAIQAFDESDMGKGRKALQITIDFDVDNGRCQKIKVMDDGPGISIERLSDAMKPAQAPTKKKLSEFGIGMKAASIWLGKKWILTTFPKGDDGGYQVQFDLDELIARNSHTLPVSNVKKEVTAVCGVEIQIKNLRAISEEAVQEAVTLLHDVYQIFLYRQKTLKFQFLVNGEANVFKDEESREVPRSLTYPDAEFKSLTGINEKYAFKIGKTKSWDNKNFTFKFNGQKVSGRLLIREVASQLLNPGIVLFRYGRMIKGSASRPYRPASLLGTANKAAPSKIYMELHLDGFEIDHTKGQFTFDEQEFLKAIGSNAVFKKFLIQAQKHRASYEKNNKVISVATSSDMENWLNTKREQLQAEQEEKEKREVAEAEEKKKRGKKTSTGARIKSPSRDKENPEDHNNNWVTLMPSIDVQLPHPKIKALVHEAKCLQLERCYSGAMLFRSIVEKALADRLTLTKSINAVHDHVFEKQATDGREFAPDQKENFKPQLSHMLEWVLNNKEWFPKEIRRDAFMAAQKFKKHLSSDLNGIVHEGTLTNSGKLKDIRDDSYAFVEYLISYPLPKKE